jgi:hypothetical protein
VFLGDPTIGPKVGNPRWFVNRFAMSDPDVPMAPPAFGHAEDAALSLAAIGRNIRFSVPGPCHASVDLYDVQGRLLARLFDETGARGSYSITWDGLATGGSAAPGIYFCRLVADDKVITQKVVMAR